MDISKSKSLFSEKVKRPVLPRVEKIPLIQIIDDDVKLLILLKDAFEEKGWMVIANTTLDKAVSQYFDENPDCLIVDADLSGISGFKILEDLQKHTSKMFVPKIILSNKNDKNTRLNAFRNGADDFISKPIDLEELMVRIERHLKRKQIYDQSVLLDELTQLYNRKFLNDVFLRNLNELKRSDHPFSIAILDLDHFKKINDQYGHLIGDIVLSTFASFLKTSTRNSDTVFRYGGEEFVILFPNTNISQALEIVSRLLENFSREDFFANGNSFKVTFSAGVHSILSQKETLKTALDIADQALYKAKELGRARVESINQILAVVPKRKLYLSIIDDDAIIRKMLEKELELLEINYYEVNVQAFKDGTTFLNSNRLLEHGQHILILDVIMPGMDGIEILRKVRQGKFEHNVLVIMLTGRQKEEDIALALKNGADDYMTKPFSISELQSRIERLLYRIKLTYPH